MPIWESISKDCKDLITKMLRPAAKRLTAAQVLEHPWFKIIEAPKGSLPPVVTNRLNKFRSYQKVQQAVLTYIATQLSEQDIMPLRLYFLTLDKNGDGILSRDEVMEGLKKSEIAGNLIETVDALDTNASGFIDYNGIFLKGALKNCRIFGCRN